MSKYLFENNTKGDLILPKTTDQGVRVVGVKRRFEGDEYYLKLVRSGDLRLIESVLTENKGNTMEKLITEQPPTVTNEGCVEFVKKDEKVRKLNETTPSAAAEEVLINESPLDGIEIV